MDIPFNLGDPVYYRDDPNRIGTVTGVIEPAYDAMGIPMRLAQVTVSPPGRKYTTVVYYEDELEICNCAIRRPRRAKHVKSQA